MADISNAINGQLNAAQVKLTGVPVAGDEFTATIDGNMVDIPRQRSRAPAPLPGTDISNALNAKLTAIDNPTTAGVSVVGDKLNITVNGTAYTTAALPAAATTTQMAAAILSRDPG